VACCRFVRPLDPSCSSLVVELRMDLSKTIESLPNSATGYFGSMAESYAALRRNDRPPAGLPVR
jgi:hypothetical protein